MQKEPKLLTALVVGGDLDNAAFRAMVEALPVAIYTTDADGHLTYFNAAAEKPAGRKPERHGQMVRHLGVFLPDDVLTARPVPHGRCATGSRSAYRDRSHCRTAGRYTALVYPLFRALSADAQDGSPAAINLLMDITERKQ